MKKLLFISLSVIMLSMCAFTPILSANAMSLTESKPSYSLYCKDNVIKSEKVDYKVSSVIDNKIEGTIEYQIEGVQGQEYTFYIPSNCPYYETAQYDVKVDGKTVQTQFLYGESEMLYKTDNSLDNAIARSSLGFIDETVSGTFYKFTANADSLTVSFTLEDTQSIIFDIGGNSFQSSSGVNGYSYTIPTTVGQEYGMFVTKGDLAKIETTATYTKTSKSCKDYIDENYLPYKEMYSQCKMPIELFYSKMNKLLDKKSMVTSNDFFWHNQTYSLNFYKFSIELEQPIVNISYVEKTNIQTKTDFEPRVYLLERKTSSNYLTTYSIEMTEELPYVIENNVALENTGLVYKATSTNDSFYCVYSSEKQPVNKFDNAQNPNNTWLIVVVSVCSVMLVGCIVVFIVMKKKGY